MSHADSLLAILERERARQERARLHAHEYRAAVTRNVCVDCGRGQWYHGQAQAAQTGERA